MLGKLIKYEFKATMRTFVPIYVVLLVIAMTNRVFNETDIQLGFGISATLVCILFMALLVVTVMVIVKRFNRNLLGDEGYLMMTLPVKVEQLIFSKIITSIIWTITSTIIAVLTFFILVGEINFVEFSEFIVDFRRALIEEVQIGDEIVRGGGVIISMLLIAILAYVAFISQIYVSLAIAQLPDMIKHRNIVSFGAYIGIGTVESMLMQLIASIVPGDLMQGFTLAAICIIVCLLIKISICLLGTKYIIEKHLNLE